MICVGYLGDDDEVHRGCWRLCLTGLFGRDSALQTWRQQRNDYCFLDSNPCKVTGGQRIFFATWIHPPLVLSSCAFWWQVWLCSTWNSHCMLWTVLHSSDWNAPWEFFPHPLPVKDNKNLFNWAMGSHSLLDRRNTDLGSWLSLATSKTMCMSCWPRGHMGQLWSVASFYSRQ